MSGSENNLLDVIIIGGGPAGLSIAAESLYHKWGNPLILEKGDSLNQTIRHYYPDDKRVDAAYLGQEAVCAGVLCFRDTNKKNFLELIDILIQTYQPAIRLGTTVDSVKKQEDGTFLVSTSDNKEYRSKYVVVSIGRMGKPNRPDYFPQIPQKAKLHTHFDLRKLGQGGKEILVVGGGNTAVEFALSLAAKNKVALSYRQEKFTRLNPMNQRLLEEEMKSGRIEVFTSTNVQSISETPEGKPVVNFVELPPRTFDEVVFGIGGSSPVAFLQNAEIQLDARGNPLLTEDLETSVRGLFIAGELSVPPGKGSIIASFNSGKKVVEALMRRENHARLPELNLVLNSLLPSESP